jgi:hypothetical protein
VFISIPAPNVLQVFPPVMNPPGTMPVRAFAARSCRLQNRFQFFDAEYNAQMDTGNPVRFVAG